MPPNTTAPYVPGPHARAAWLMKVLVGLDQLGNALMGGDPDETISSRAARGQLFGKWVSWLMCRFLNFLDPGHCDKVVGH